jgi:hypothetical protein
MQGKVVARGHPRGFALPIDLTGMAVCRTAHGFKSLPWCGGPPRPTAGSPVLRIGLPPRYLLQHMANKQRVIDQVAVSEPLRLRHEAE